MWQSEVPINGNSPILTGDFMFKVKGQKFSESNHMTRVPVRVEKVNSVKQFLDRVMTENRLFSVLSKLSSSENNVKIFCQKVKSDIRKEENLLIEESNLDMKVLAAEIDKRAGTWFREQNKASMP